MTAEGEKLTEDLAVNPDATDECNQHEKRGNTNDVNTDEIPVQIQAVMQRVKPFAADFQLIVGDEFAGARVNGAAGVNVVVVFRVFLMRYTEAPTNGKYRVTMGGVRPEFIQWQFGARCHRASSRVVIHRHHLLVFRGVGLHALVDIHQQMVKGRHRLRLKAGVRDGPTVNLTIENRQCTKEEAHHEYESQDQSQPGMQPGHCLAGVGKFHDQAPAAVSAD